MTRPVCSGRCSVLFCCLGDGYCSLLFRIVIVSFERKRTIFNGVFREKKRNGLGFFPVVLLVFYGLLLCLVSNILRTFSLDFWRTLLVFLLSHNFSSNALLYISLFRFNVRVCGVCGETKLFALFEK